jgi:hypothetical protein
VILTLVAVLILGAGIVVGVTTFSTNLLSTTSSRG